MIKEKGNNSSFKVARKNMLKKLAIAVVILAVSLVGLKKFLCGPRYENTTTRLDGKTVIVTGANTGIGKETARDLARRGARVILACRNLEKARLAADDIKNSTGSDKVLVKHLDLASLKSVRHFAKEIIEEERRLDILINNAGIMWCPHWKTEDGFEMQFGTNHLGHFLLTNLLLDLLKKSAPSRVVTVSSKAHERGFMNFDDLNSEKEYDYKFAYAQSKLANVLFSRELSKRLKGTGVTTYSLHPGVIYTDLIRHGVKLNTMFYVFDKLQLRYLIKNPEDGAQTTLFCAIDESLAKETGKYYSDVAEKTPSKEAQDDEAAKTLWEISEKMVGL